MSRLLILAALSTTGCFTAARHVRVGDAHVTSGELVLACQAYLLGQTRSPNHRRLAESVAGVCPEAEVILHREAAAAMAAPDYGRARDLLDELARIDPRAARAQETELIHLMSIEAMDDLHAGKTRQAVALTRSMQQWRPQHKGVQAHTTELAAELRSQAERAAAAHDHEGMERRLELMGEILRRSDARLADAKASTTAIQNKSLADQADQYAHQGALGMAVVLRYAAVSDKQDDLIQSWVQSLQRQPAGRLGVALGDSDASRRLLERVPLSRIEPGLSYHLGEPEGRLRVALSEPVCEDEVEVEAVERVLPAGETFVPNTAKQADEAQLARMKDRLRDLRSAIAHQNGYISENTALEDALRAQIANYRHQSKLHQDAIEELKEQRRTLQVELHDTHDTRRQDRLQQRVDGLTLALRREQAASAQLTRTLDNLGEQLTATGADLLQAEQVRRALLARRTDLGDRIDARAAALADVPDLIRVEAFDKAVVQQESWTRTCETVLSAEYTGRTPGHFTATFSARTTDLAWRATPRLGLAPNPREFPATLDDLEDELIRKAADQLFKELPAWLKDARQDAVVRLQSSRIPEEQAMGLVLAWDAGKKGNDEVKRAAEQWMVAEDSVTDASP